MRAPPTHLTHDEIAMSTLEELKTLIQKSYGIDPVTLKADAPLAEYGLDSLALAELLFSVEDHFDLELSDTPATVSTLAGLAALIDAMKAAKA